MEGFVTGLLILITFVFSGNMRQGILCIDAHSASISTVDDSYMVNIICNISNRNLFEKIRWYTQEWEQIGENCQHFDKVGHEDFNISCGTNTIGANIYSLYYLTVLSVNRNHDGIYTCTYMGANYTSTVITPNAVTTVTTTETPPTIASTTTVALTTTTACPEAGTEYHARVISITVICTCGINAVIWFIIIVLHRKKKCHCCLTVMGLRGQVGL